MDYKKIVTKMSKDKKFKGLDLGLLVSELQGIENGLLEHQDKHQVPVNGSKYMAYGSKVLNKYFNQTGRGDYRILTQKGSIAGIATHKKDNSYKLQYVA